MKKSKIFSWVFLGAAGIGVEAGLLTLANWQHHRYLQRLTEQAAFAALPTRNFSGTFDNSHTVALTNQPNPLNPDAEVGWRILTPLQSGSNTLIVDRGWTPESLNPDNTPNFTPFETSATTVQGLYQLFPQRHGWLKGPDTTTHPKLLAFLNPVLISSNTTVPVYLIARSSTSPGLIANPPPLASPQRHLSYMLQWIGLSIAFPILCLYAFLKNRPTPKRKKR
jgi:cytochrome oxidase assembly protein ShyY1